MSARPLGALLLLAAALAAASSAQALRGAFPCSVAGLGLRPAIIFLGEWHSSPSSISARDTAIRHGARGFYHVMVETTKWGPVRVGRADELLRLMRLPVEGAKVWGLENSLASAFTDLWLYSTKGSPLYLDSPEKARALLLDAADDASLRQAFWDAITQGRLPDGRAARFIRDAVSNPTAVWRAQLSDEDVQALRLAAEEARVAMAAMMKVEYDSRRVDEIVDALGPRAEPKTAQQGVMSEIRDRDYALVAASHYCQTAHEGAPLVLAVGDAHVEGIRRHLRDWADAELRFEHYPTREPADSAIARLVLDRLAGSTETPSPTLSTPRITALDELRRLHDGGPR